MSEVDIMDFHHLFSSFWRRNNNGLNLAELKVHDRSVFLGQVSQAVMG
jgi:hypothetical protein